MNNLSIAGNIGKDARVNQVQTSKGMMSVANFSLAVQTRQKDQATGKSISLWFDCAMWGERADKLAQYLTAGTKVAVVGEVGADTYTDGQGNVKPKLTVRVSDITLMGSANQSGQAATQSQARPQQQYQQAPQQRQPSGGYNKNDVPPIDFDDIPF